MTERAIHSALSWHFMCVPIAIPSAAASGVGGIPARFHASAERQMSAEHSVAETFRLLLASPAPIGRNLRVLVVQASRRYGMDYVVIRRGRGSRSAPTPGKPLVSIPLAWAFPCTFAPSVFSLFSSSRGRKGKEFYSIVRFRNIGYRDFTYLPATRGSWSNRAEKIPPPTFAFFNLKKVILLK